MLNVEGPSNTNISANDQRMVTGKQTTGQRDSEISLKLGNKGFIVKNDE